MELKTQLSVLMRFNHSTLHKVILSLFKGAVSRVVKSWMRIWIRIRIEKNSCIWICKN